MRKPKYVALYLLLATGAAVQAAWAHPKNFMGVSTGIARSAIVGSDRAHYGTNRHLWAVNGGVRSYPLSADGRPSTIADSVLFGGLQSPISIGFDGAGFLYVTDSPYVKVYAPHAIGQTPPVRVINVAGSEWIAVDPAGYVYVTSGYGAIDVFAPGAGTSSLPINVIPVPPSQLFFTLTLDNQGHLYAADLTLNIFEYDDPIHEQIPDRTFQRSATLAWPIAFDTDDNRLYFRVQPPNFYPWTQGEYGALAPDFQPLPKRGNFWLFATDDCVAGGSNGTVENGLAVNRNYLMFSCDVIPGGLFVYHNDPGRQAQRVETIKGGPSGLILGP